MPKTKIEIILGLLLVVAVAGLSWWLFFGPTPKQKFLRDVEKMVTVVNEGNHASVKDRFSPEFIDFIGQQGFQPQQIILIVHQLDTNQNAQYRLYKLTIFEPNDFAEVEFARKSSGAEEVFTLPFVYRKGKWWITDKFRSEKQWEAFPSL